MKLNTKIQNYVTKTISINVMRKGTSSMPTNYFLKKLLGRNCLLFVLT